LNNNEDDDDDDDDDIGNGDRILLYIIYHIITSNINITITINYSIKGCNCTVLTIRSASAVGNGKLIGIGLNPIGE
jgi:hypothetical protein